MTELRHVQDGVLMAMIDGSLDAVPVGAVDHVRDCLDCRRRRSELAHRSRSLTRLFEAEDQAPRDVEDRAWRYGASNPRAPGNRLERHGAGSFGTASRRAAVAAAAVVLIAVILSPVGASLRGWLGLSEGATHSVPTEGAGGATSYAFEPPQAQLTVRLHSIRGQLSIQRDAGRTVRVAVQGGDGSESVAFGQSELKLQGGGTGAAFVVTIPVGLSVRAFDDDGEVELDAFGEGRN